jgi:hypothetical protein
MEKLTFAIPLRKSSMQTDFAIRPLTNKKQLQKTKRKLVNCEKPESEQSRKKQPSKLRKMNGKTENKRA